MVGGGNYDPSAALAKSTESSYSGVTNSSTGRHSKRRPLNPSLFGKPVEEVDPFVFEDTFCVIARKFGKFYIYRFSASRSLFIFGPLNPIRRIACRLICSTLFDLFIMVIILINCVTLALESNWENGISTKMIKDKEKEDIINIFEFVYLGIYTLEMFLEVLAKGFVFNKFSYLRSFWSILDFFVVLSSYFAVYLEENQKESQGASTSTSNDDDPIDLDFLPALRVLRAIKTISIIPGLRVMINSLLKSVKQLVEVMFLTMFFLLILSLVALQLYNGKLLHKCVLIKNGVEHVKMVTEMLTRYPHELSDGPINPNNPEAAKLWYEWIHREDNWLRRKDGYPIDEYVPCGNGSYSRLCPEGYVCLKDIGESFDNGWTNFDDFLYSMLTTFQLLTTDFWERPYDLILSTTSPLSVLFVIIVIYLGFYYLLNLMLAVVAMSYEEEYHQSTMVPMTKHQKLSVNRQASTFSFDDPTKLKVTAMTHYKKRSPSEREMLARTLQNQTMAKQELESLTDFDGKKRPNLHNAILTLLGRRVSMEGKPAKVGKSNASRSIADQWVNNLESRVSDEVPRTDSNISPMNAANEKTVRLTISPSGESRKISLKTGPGNGRGLRPEKRSTLTSATIGPLNSCTKCLARMKENLKPIVISKAFEIAITTVIIINTILLASEHHEQPDWLKDLLAMSNHFFSAMFLVEAVLKICALQKEYFQSWWNNFDLVIVTLSVIDSLSEFLLEPALGFIIFRVFRLLRVFKLAQSWITMKVLLNIIFSTFGALGNLTLVLVLVLYMFAILGLQTIGKEYTKKAFDAETDENKFPRWNFQNFWYAFMLTFRVLCGEWIEPMGECFQATAEKGEEYKCLILFLTIFIFGNLIILNLFLALLLNSFDTEQLESERELAVRKCILTRFRLMIPKIPQNKELEASGKKSEILKKQIVGMLMSHKSRQSEESSTNESRLSIGQNVQRTHTTVPIESQGRARFQRVAKKILIMNRKAVAEKMIEKTNLRKKQLRSARYNMRHNALIAERQSSFALGATESGSIPLAKDMRIPDACVPRKLWSTNCCMCNWLRRRRWVGWDSARWFASRIVSHPIFEWTILALILASSITLCFEDVTLDRKKNLKDALFYINTTFTAIFVVEMLLKWFALGLWTYFTSSWTILDFFIVVVSLVSWYYGMVGKMGGKPTKGKSQIAAFKALRTLRALRPLRAISRWQGMKIVVNALMFAIPSIVNVLLVCLLFWLIFAIVGVQLFKGKFHRCVDNKNGETVVTESVKNKTSCCENSNKYSWINQTPNFDNVLQGYLILFQVATFEGWMEAMRASVDSTDVNMQPERDSNLMAYIFFVIFIVFGSFFTLNLFIGVIIDNFNRLKKKYEGNLVEVLLTPSQRNYYTAMKKLGRKKPRKVIKRPKSELLSLFYDISMSRRFEIAIFVMIFLNMIILALERHNMRKIYHNILAGMNFFFATVYGLEALVKIIGLRQYYFTVLWNLFDFILVIGSIVEIVAADWIGEDGFPFPPTMLRIIRVFRIGRVLRLIKAAKGIRKLLFALIVSLPALFNIGALLSLIVFIYAILGMSLFANTAKNQAIDEMFNFDTFLNSCLMLLRVMTMAAGWNDVLSALTVEEPDCGTYRNIECGSEETGECPNFGVAVLYFVSFLMITHLIVINMYVAIILENFYDASREEEVGIVEDDLEMFYIQWSRYDPQATQFISFDQLSEFLGSLDRPLGIPRPNIVAIVAFNLPIARGNKIHCLDVLHALVKHVIGHIDDTEDFRKLQEQMEHKFRKQFPTRKLLDIISSTRVWKIQHNAAVVIQRGWRTYQARKRAHEAGKSSLSVPHMGISRASRIGKEHHGMFNKMGNLLHLNHNNKGNQKRRLSINEG